MILPVCGRIQSDEVHWIHIDFHCSGLQAEMRR